MVNQQINTNTFGVAKWIVSATAYDGTHTTIAAALTAASSGDTIFIRPGTYTENLTLKAGVALTAFDCDANAPNVTIVGKATFTAAGLVSISGIRLQTNSDFFLAVTGSAASQVVLTNCYLNCSNNTGISFTSSSGSAVINSNYCLGDLGTTGIAFFASSSAGGISFYWCNLGNSGASTTASTASAGTANFLYSNLPPHTTSGTAGGTISHCWFSSSATNTTCLTHGGSTIVAAQHCKFQSGTASAISIGAGSTLNIISCDISSSNTNVITGAGTIQYSGLSFGNTSSNINTTTQTVRTCGPTITVGSTNTGNTNTITATNPSDTASSSANIVSSVGGTSAGDATFQSVVSGTTTWTWGIDNSVTSPTADPWVLAQGTTLGTNNVMSVATSGEINYPLQPAFLATAATQSNVTGDGTVYTVIFTNEIFDQNADFDGTSTLTAPVTGRYSLKTSVTFTGIGAANTNTCDIQIVTSNRTYDINIGNLTVIKDATNNVYAASCSVLGDMDAADTCVIKARASGGTKTIGIQATNSFFSGALTA